MRKNILLILFFVATTHAQPIITDANFPTEYTRIGNRASTVGFTNGSPGANQIWDYSEITLEERNFSYTVIPITSMPFYESFPSANYCEKQNDNGLISYYAYNLNPVTYEYLGFVDGATVGQYVDTSLIVQFPYTFNSEISDTSLSNFPDAIPTTQIRTYDAYGTLITPFGKFDNVIRQKVVQLKNIFGEGGTGYIWFRSNPFQIIISGNFENQFVYFWKDVTNLSINSVSSPIFTVYPNPTNGDFTIQYNNNFNSEIFATVYDVLGKIVLPEQLLTNEMQNIYSSSLDAGLYFVKITNKENQILQTEKIIKQ